MKQILNTIAVFILAITLLGSCQSVMEEPITEEVLSSNSSKIYSIPANEALQYLEDFMRDEIGTRSTVSRKITSINPIRYRSFKTRSEEENIDTLLYIVNFEDEGGYAILAADQRIPDKVIAIVDEGTISSSTVEEAIELIEDRPIFPGYPITGPGFFTNPETGDELFMNPNTVDLYNPEIDDTLVGNFKINRDCERIDSTYTNLISDVEYKEADTSFDIQLFTTAMCVNHAITTIQNPNKDYTYLENPECEDENDPNSGLNPPTTTYKYRYDSWNIQKQVYPKLRKFYYWSQHEPYNKYYPYRLKNSFNPFSDIIRAPAGCFPLALAKIMAYHKFPSDYNTADGPIDWKLLQDWPLSSDGKNTAAVLLYWISKRCKSLYFGEGTFTYPSFVTKFMRNLRYTQAHNRKYNFGHVVAMLDADNPIIIYGMPRWDLRKSHSWNVDGYKIKQRIKYTDYYEKDAYKYTKESMEITNMVHCDFGHGTEGNGYYVSGVFDQTDSSAEYDVFSTPGEDKYDTYLHVITYNNPN